MNKVDPIVHEYLEIASVVPVYMNNFSRNIIYLFFCPSN
jgi:hypothetical protein